jgi:hypothetical protein
LTAGIASRWTMLVGALGTGDTGAGGSFGSSGSAMITGFAFQL